MENENCLIRTNVPKFKLKAYLKVFLIKKLNFIILKQDVFKLKSKLRTKNFCLHTKIILF